MFLILTLFSCLFLNLIPASYNSSNHNSIDDIFIPNDLSQISLKDLQYQNSNNVQAVLSTMSVVPEKLLKLSEKVNSAFNFIANRIDTILTKKGVIKTLIILGPLFTLYCYFFSPEPVMALINKIISSAAYGASKIASYTVDGFTENQADIDIAINKISDEYGMIEGRRIVMTEIGQMHGLFQSIWEYPFSTIALLANKGTNMVLGNGVPFIAALLANNLWKRTPGG